jgi:hypothetical protein
MTPEEAIVDRLEQDGAVAAIVGDRVYNFMLPQSPILPAVRVYSIGDPPQQYHLRGPDALIAGRVQIDAIVDGRTSSDPWGTAWQLAEAIDAALSGQVFTDAGSPPSVRVRAMFRKTRMPIYHPEELRQFKVIQDYEVWSQPL